MPCLKIANAQFRTRVVWCQKRTLYQLRHNWRCPCLRFFRYFANALVQWFTLKPKLRGRESRPTFFSLIRGKSLQAIFNRYLWPMRCRDICSDRKLFYKIGHGGKSPYILLRRQYASKWYNLEPGLKPYLHGDHSGFNALTMTEISNELKNAFAHLGTNTAKLILPWYNCSKISAQFRSCTQRVFKCTYLYLLLRTR